MPSLAVTLEPHATALLLVIVGVLVAFSVLFSRTIDRLGIPVVLLFLLLGMLGGSEGIGGLAFDNYAMAARFGTVALVLILFDGGLNTSVATLRRVAAPASVLATFGVVLTAGAVAVAAWLLGLAWTTALLLGAVVSSTDAAAVFAVLRGGRLQLQPRVRHTIEVESCINDPMAIILTMTLIGLATAGGASWTMAAMEVPLQLAMGTGVGLLFGWAGRAMLCRVPIPTTGLYPALTLALAFLSYGAATLARGSGFLAVFLTGLVLGAGRLPYRDGLARVHDALAWLSQVGMFLMLGLLVFPSQLVPVAWKGLVLALALALIARPLVVWLCLLPFRYPRTEVGYVGCAGLRGAVPIILATFPVLAQVPDALGVFNLVFFIVVVSSLVPGTLIRPLARWLRLTIPDRGAPSAVLEVHSTYPLNCDLASFQIDPSVAVCGAHLSDLALPEGAAVALIVRGRELVAARPSTVIQAGDHVFVFFQPGYRPTIELLFGSPESGRAA